VIHIVDDRRHRMSAGEPGVIYFEESGRHLRYHKDPGKSAESRFFQPAKGGGAWAMSVTSTTRAISYLTDEVAP